MRKIKRLSLVLIIANSMLLVQRILMFFILLMSSSLLFSVLDIPPAFAEQNLKPTKQSIDDYYYIITPVGDEIEITFKMKASSLGTVRIFIPKEVVLEDKYSK